MPAWLQNEGAWIALGVSLFFLLAGFVMHRVFVRVLKGPPASSTPSNEPHE
jgi:peptidoglycan/LPS O-acetylase OafA/YrhL